MIQQDLVIEKQYVDDKKVTVLTLKGQLDAHTFNILETTVDEIFAEDCYRFIFRLDNLDYVASAGMGVFIATLARAQERQGDVVLVNPVHKVKAIFEMFGLLEAFKIVPDVNAALAAFQ